MSTATEMQSDEIRARMRSIRNDLPYDMDDAREQIQQLSDWKFYIRKMPIASVASVAAVAFLAVPSAKPAARTTRIGSEGEATAAKSGLLGSLVGAVASMAFRTGTDLALLKASDFFLDGQGLNTSKQPTNKQLTS